MYNRYSIFLDDTEIYTSLHQSLPTFYLYGGILIEDRELRKLCTLIDTVKLEHGTLECPLKYNFKDLKSEYKGLNIQDLYDPLLQSSKVWRNNILERAKEIDYQVVISCVQKYHSQDSLIRKNKNSYIQYAFTYCMQRFGWEQKQRKGSSTLIYADWPSGSSKGTFQKEYHSAFHYGYTSNWVYNYSCGPLHEIGFNDSINFTISEESRALQFTDIIMGATKEFLSKKLDGKESFGEDLSAHFIEKFRGYPNILSRGFILSSNSSFKPKIEEIFSELVKR